MRYRRAPAGGGISIVVAVRAMSAVIRRAAARGAVPCRISPAVSFLRLVEYRFSSPRTVYEFPASSVPFRCLVPYSPALYGVMSNGRGCRVRFASVSSRRIVSSSRSVSSFRFRLVSSTRLVSTRAAIRFARYGSREGVSFGYSYGHRFLKIPYGFSIQRRYGGISVLPRFSIYRFSIYHDTSYYVNFLYSDMHIGFGDDLTDRSRGNRS